MSEDIQKLEDMKEKIAELESQVQQHRGALKSLTDRLHTEFGYSSIEAAEHGLKQLDVEVRKLENELNASLEEADRLLGA